MIKTVTSPASSTTRDRMIEVAHDHFSARSFDACNLRDIAADVGVDVAYLHRSQGGKQKLFQAVIDRALEMCFEDAKRCSTFTRFIIERIRNGDLRTLNYGPLPIISQSLACEAVKPQIQDAVQRLFVDPLIAEHGEKFRVEIVAVSMLFLGMKISSPVLPTALLSKEQQTLLDEIAVGMLAALLGGE
ncbi:hypothetical protein [Thioclava sp. GXIMD2076]|uniref:TetR/AcrR family transcriptional regulator n=1 Tax=Thioclava sp. GXIMD2076 TaxID=3131931 RepID=UPI0030D152CA